VERSEVGLDDLEADQLFFRLPQGLEPGSEDARHLEGAGFGKTPDSVHENSCPLPVEVFARKDLHEVGTGAGAEVPPVNIDPRGSHEVQCHHILMGQTGLVPGIFLGHAPNLM